MKHFFLSVILILTASLMKAQSSKSVTKQADGWITFSVDQVDRANTSINGWVDSAEDIAMNIAGRAPEIFVCSFENCDNLHNIGEDVLFSMLRTAWCQHRPVVLTPDAIWLVICQQFSYYVNKHPDKFRDKLVNHTGKMPLNMVTEKDIMDKSGWEEIIADFVSKISIYTNNDISTNIVADFSTTGLDELIASEVSLMDVVKPFFEYNVMYVICGIPSITLAGTSEDWRKVLEKTRSLKKIGMEWWLSELEPILMEFVKAAEGNPDYWLWKDIVKKSRPRKVTGPSCYGRNKQLTKFDGWFLKFFPFDGEGKTHGKVTILDNMLAETVVVPVKWSINYPDGKLKEVPLELVAGIVAVQEDPVTFTLTPKIGWFVRRQQTKETTESDDLNTL